MGSNRFLNSEGQDVDISELLNEINVLSEEVQGKLDKDGTDGGMTGNLGLNNNNIINVNTSNTQQTQTELIVKPSVGQLPITATNGVLITENNLPSGEIFESNSTENKSYKNLNMNGNEINNCSNIVSVQNAITLDQEVGSAGGVINSQNLTRVGNAYIGTLEIATASNGDGSGTLCGFTISVPRSANFVSAAQACGTVTVQDGNAPGAYDSKAGGGLNAVIGAKQITMETNINYQNIGARIISLSFFYLA
jgi:hypothetical protein